ncbi:galactokinase [Dictyobacter vulcani]|uniref:Galactokinase n=1 Tax=Dictyobacter vulcani TaxID=2607529 RepID=A0A5J4KI68_9CHLR|nr:galactokinase [Dictyobacter vulcani]GER85869.1 galactokinase [Dictyobacter vulcani]
MDSTTLLPPVKEAIEQFPHHFHEDAASYASPLGAAWAPGRVNLIGEHTDYNGGYVLPLAVDRVSAFAGRTRNDQTVRLWSTHFNAYAQFSLAGLPESFEEQREKIPGWARYVLGVATELIKANITLKGFDAVITGDVPLGGGMSSSAALEVASAQAYALFSNHSFSIGEDNATLTPLETAGLCQKAEQNASGLMSGILDQAASCLGQPRKAILLDCRSLEYRYLPFEDPGVSVVVIDTGVRRELASSAYNERRKQCEEATQRIRTLILENEPDNTEARSIKALRDITPEQFEQYKGQLPQILQQRAGYIIAENERVLQVVKLLEAGKIEEAGKILWLGHAGLRDEYEVSCKELDVLVDIARDVPGVLGARMMGGGFGGCTINLVRNEAVDALSQAVERHYQERTGRQASIDICRAAAGPSYVLFEN